MKSAASFRNRRQGSADRAATPIRPGAGRPRTTRILSGAACLPRIASTGQISSLVLPPDVGLSPWTNRNWCDAVGGRGEQVPAEPEQVAVAGVQAGDAAARSMASTSWRDRDAGDRRAADVHCRESKKAWATAQLRTHRLVMADVSPAVRANSRVGGVISRTHSDWARRTRSARNRERLPDVATRADRLAGCRTAPGRRA